MLRRGVSALVASFSMMSVLALVALSGVLALTASAAQAESLSPWWSLESNARPTYLHPGGGTNEVQEIKVSATGGEWLLEKERGPEGNEATAPYVVVPYNASATEVQELLQGESLEGQEMFGAGNVEVTGGCEEPQPITEPGRLVCSYRIAFKGALAQHPVPPIETWELALENGAKPAVTVVQSGHAGDQIVVTAANLGDAAVQAASAPVTITDKLPAGVEVVGTAAIAGIKGHPDGPVDCSEPKALEVRCTYEGTLPAFQQIEVEIDLGVTSGAHPEKELNEVSVSGGGAPSKSVSGDVTFSEAPVPFGVEKFTTVAEEEGGSADTQAGSHPFQVTGSILLNQVLTSGEPFPAQLPKDLAGPLPAGLIGNPTPIPHCPQNEFLQLQSGLITFNECPPASAVGVAIVTIDEPAHSLATGAYTFTDPIFNLEPEEGEPARFGFYLPGTPVYIDASVRSGRDYGVTLTSHNVSQTAALLGIKLVFWGVPGAPAHDGSRGNDCQRYAQGETAPCNPLEAVDPPPFVSLPVSCQVDQHTGEPQQLPDEIEGDSWIEPQKTVRLEGAPIAALDGCNRPPFTPEIEVKPDSDDASTASGMTVDVHVPQAEAVNAGGVAPAEPRNITVALPAGVAVNPSGGDGLQSCSQALVGFEGYGEFNPDSEPGARTAIFSPYLPGSIVALAAGDSEPLQPGVNFCPDASKIGNVTIDTPILPDPIKGAVYLATQNQNPFGSLLSIYAVAEDRKAGVLVKLAGKITLCKAAGETVDQMTCGAPGQVITRFENSPQAPFEDARFEFYGGEKAPLATPARCGSYTTRASFVPWNSETPVDVSTNPKEFEITAGPNGTPCPGASLPFSPSLTGGATNVNAGAFSPFTLTMNRKDGEQNIQSVEAKLPPGLSGVLSNVQLCPEPQANLGECPAGSLIGESTVSVGVGSDPYTVSGGKFYLTGPYNGAGACTVGQPGCAPFGVTFEVPAKAGPFDLANTPDNHPPCDCVLVRGKIQINPYTAAITITSNPPGTPDAIPTSIEGIPLEIQHINAITTRGNFQFNPTNCSKMEVSGTIHSSAGGIDTLGVPFQVTNCKNLNFTPKFKVSVGAKTSKANGASLTTSVTEPAGSLGTQANLARVKVELPKQLPSRLTTLQKACTSKQFELNPANCPSESKIGYAVVHTPLVPVPLEGPAIFVSHGGEAFPSLTMVLQGYGVTIDLVGTTFISKSGVTSTTFKTVPDQPFSSFSLTLPTGKFSALTALGNVCQEKLQMPTEFIAQNGMEIHQVTNIGVTGCKKLTRSQKLKAALKVCHKDKNKGRRQKCEKAARKKFGPLKKKTGKK